jgi:hypothetical protein
VVLQPELAQLFEVGRLGDRAHARSVEIVLAEVERRESLQATDDDQRGLLRTASATPLWRGAAFLDLAVSSRAPG